MKRAANNAAILKGAKKNKVDLNAIQALGKIDSISLKNFMCHENFELKFGQRMNFIIGQNGSGKSAILTALILALGGASKVTGRFSNIKGFIKTGKQRAKVEVVLHNCGEAAYKPELYGDKITIMREFTIDGANYYKLKSEAGKVLASTKDELLNVLNAMDIHVNNPVQVLTQETSRTFLLSKHAKGDKLYEFFFQGTCLQALEESYNSVKVTKDEAKQLLDGKIKALPGMRRELEQWKKFLESSAKIEEYKNELVWAGVIEMESILKKKQDDFSKMENALKINKQEIEKCKVLLDTKIKELDESTKKRSECSAALSEYRNKVLQLKSDHETCNLALRKHEGSLALYSREEQKILYEMQNLENRINENKQKTQIDVQEEERKRVAEVERLQNENHVLSEKLVQLQRKQRSKEEEKEQATQKMENLAAEINGLEYNMKRIHQNMDHVQMALKDKMNVFGAHTQKVLNEISARQREFKKLPVGPIGMYIEVKDPRWCPAIEKSVSSGLLCSYCVDNYQDDRILKDIMRKHCAKMPSTIVCPFNDQMYDVSQHKAQTNFPTVLDMLKFKNVQAANALIDQAQIENVILIEDMNTGQDLMLNNPPRNCKAAYIINCDQICLAPYRYYSETNPNRPSLLSSLQKNEITQLKDRLSELSSETNSKKEQLRQLQKHFGTIPAELKDLDNQIIHFTCAHGENCEKLKELKCVKKTDDVYCLQEDLQTLMSEHESKRAEIAKCEAEVAKYKEEKEKIIREKEEVKKLLHEEKARYDEMALRINQYNTEKETLSTGKTKFENETKACEKKLQILEKDLNEIKEKTEFATRNAERVCDRIDTENDCDTIRRQLAETKKVVESQSNCNKNEVAQKYLEKRERYKEAEKELERLRSYLTRLEGMYKLRFNKFKDIKQHTRVIVNVTFVSILAGNGFTGSLKFDDKNRTLKLEVSPKKGLSAKQNHSILSGGERSFVTIAFLLALWEKTSMPFRVLDEYDVFMDSSNRQLSVDLLVRKAEDMASTQFIFLSPLDLPLISCPENVTIHRMVPPKRIDT